MGMQVFAFAPGSRGAWSFRTATKITAIALFVIASYPILLAQMHGIRATPRPIRVGTGPQARPGFSARRTGVTGARPLGHRSFIVQRFPFRHHRHFSFFLANACFNDPFFDPFICRQFFFRQSRFFGEPLLLPYPVYAETSYAAPEQSVPGEEFEGADISGRIDRLTDEVERLREEQESAKNSEQTPGQGEQAAEANLPTRILVFRDGRRSEIQNYAMVGKILWVLTQERARKIPVSDLDMDATKKANADQGIEFP
jgi:hypothetical protein